LKRIGTENELGENDDTTTTTANVTNTKTSLSETNETEKQTKKVSKKKSVTKQKITEEKKQEICKFWSTRSCLKVSIVTLFFTDFDCQKEDFLKTKQVEFVFIVEFFRVRNVHICMLEVQKLTKFVDSIEVEHVDVVTNVYTLTISLKRHADT
jgi:hypothetical protein